MRENSFIMEYSSSKKAFLSIHLNNVSKKFRIEFKKHLFSDRLNKLQTTKT